MRRIIVSAMIFNLLLIVLSGCTRSRSCCDGCYGSKEYNALWDRNDCWHRYGNLMVPREFFDARDFRPDSIYGDPRGWRNEDYSSFCNDECRHQERALRWNSHYRHHWHGFHRGHEDAASERYMPPMAPDMEYDE